MSFHERRPKHLKLIMPEDASQLCESFSHMKITNEKEEKKKETCSPNTLSATKNHKRYRTPSQYLENQPGAERTMGGR